MSEPSKNIRKAHFKSRCLRDLKIIKRRGWDEEKFNEVVTLLILEGRLSSHLKPHRLKGKYAGLWECHIELDWLLIYDVTDKEVLLARTGTHADLFE